MNRNVVLLGVLAASLAGCDKLPGFGPPASPHRRLGLWEQTVTSDRRPTPIVTELCFDAMSDQRMPALPHKPRLASACEKYQVARNGDTYVIDATCTFGGVRRTSHTEISGDFTTRYTTANTITIEGSSDPARDGQHRMTMNAVYKGANCDAAGLQPGQVKLPDGEVVGMAQLRSRFVHGGGSRGGGAGPAGG